VTVSSIKKISIASITQPQSKRRPENFDCFGKGLAFIRRCDRAQALSAFSANHMD
jgi:hypothetical protein